MPRQTQGSATPINADYSSEPLYGGALFTPSTAANVQPVALQSPVESELQQGMAAQTQAAYAFDQALIERNDYALGLMRKAEAAQIEAAARAELEMRMNAADGDADSFYDANHQPRIEAQQDFVNKYRELTNNLSMGFVGEQAKQNAVAMQAQFQNSLQPLLATKFLEQGALRAKTAFDTNFYALLTAGKFNEAISSLKSGFVNGAVAPYEATGYYNKAKIAYAKMRAQQARVGGGSSSFDLNNLSLDAFSHSSQAQTQQLQEESEAPDTEIDDAGVTVPVEFENL